MSSPPISVENLVLTLESRAGPVGILNGLTFEIASGQSVAIVGPSGSGKTSLLMVLAGLERPTSGRVSVTGRNFAMLNEDQRALARGESIGIVFQAFHLVPTMTALENVALPLEFRGVAGAVETAKARLAEVGLTHRLDHYPVELSGGEQQRVAIARALSIDPKLILADEPTGNLDQKTGQSVVELLFGLQRERKSTLVLVTHDERLAAECDRVLRMADGLIIDDRWAKAA